MLLDNPADFGVWGVVAPGHGAEFRAWIAEELGIPKLTAQQFYGADVRNLELVEIHSGYGWLEIKNLLEKLPYFIDKSSVKITVSNVKPAAHANYCREHSLYYGRGACPVCTGNIIHHGRRRG